VATDLAAGLAALMLYCAQIWIACDDPPDPAAVEHFREIKTHEGMVTEFDTTHKDNRKYFPVWEISGKTRGNFTVDEYIHHIKEVAVRLCSNL
jgi:hypothetical protein